MHNEEGMSCLKWVHSLLLLILFKFDVIINSQIGIYFSGRYLLNYSINRTLTVKLEFVGGNK